MSEFQELHRWAIEVDQGRDQPNLAAQVEFLCGFGSDLYRAVDAATGWEQWLRHVYFTRIFDPHRDSMGAYVRLHFLMAAEHSDAAEKLEERLKQLQCENKIFQIRMETIDGIEEAGRKGAASFPELYYSGSWW